MTAPATLVSRRPTIQRFAGAFVTLVAGITIAAVAVAVAVPLRAGNFIQDGPLADFLDEAVGIASFWPIFGRNVGVIALLYSGVATAGVTSVLGIPLVALGVGGFTSVLVSEHGLAATISSVWTYAPIEFLAMAVAGGSGLLPVAAAVCPALQPGETAVTRYVRSLARTLPMLGIAVVLLVVAALLEAIAIATK